MNWRTYPIWLGIVAIFISWLTNQETWDLNISEAVALLAVLVGGWIWVRRHWRTRHPFTLRFYEKPWDTEDEENIPADRKSIHCRAGEQKIVLIGIKLNMQRTFKTVDVRLVKRDISWLCQTGFFYREAPKTTAYICRFKDQQYGWATADKDNKKGGREADYIDLIDSPEGAVMWYAVTVIAHEDWNGLLSFQLRRGSSHKGVARVMLSFKMAE